MQDLRLLTMSDSHMYIAVSNLKVDKFTDEHDCFLN